MKLHKILTFTVCAASLTLASCVDLDQQPDERVNINTDEQVSKLLVTGYPSANYALLGELSSDNYEDNNAPHEVMSGSSTTYANLNPYSKMDDEVFAFEQVKSSTSSDSPSDVWASYYSSIATANHALEAIARLEAEAKAKNEEPSARLEAAKGEALLIRAYGHFILVNLFSQAYKDSVASKSDIGVPYVTEPETTVHVNYDRSNVAEVYKKIEADIVEGLPLINDAYYSKPKWHFNKNAANAFAARFYLFKRDYDKVIYYADQVLGSDRSTLASTLTKYDKFQGKTYLSDYAVAWQDASDQNNLMLMSTYSQWDRHNAYGCRYGIIGRAMKQTVYRTGPTWNWTIMPCFNVGGFYVNGSIDYGLFPLKIWEQFEYTDKVSGIGYLHIIRREFTRSELVLERAEAELLSSTQRNIPNAVADLCAYEESRQSFDEVNKTYYVGSSKNPNLWALTDSIIRNYYTYKEGRSTQNPGVVENWNFTQNMSSSFVVPEEVYPYMNCLMDMRRYETLCEGRRFFDLKRFGIEYSHTIGRNSQVITLKWNDPRRAIEIPLEAETAGLETSRPANLDNTNMTEFRSKFNAKYNTCTNK